MLHATQESRARGRSEWPANKASRPAYHDDSYPLCVCAKLSGSAQHLEDVRERVVDIPPEQEVVGNFKGQQHMVGKGWVESGGSGSMLIHSAMKDTPSRLTPSRDR